MITAQQIRLLIAFLLLSSTVNAAYTDSNGLSARTHPRDILRRADKDAPSTPPPHPAPLSIEEHTKQHLAQNPLTVVRGTKHVAEALKDKPNERHRQDTFKGSVPILPGTGPTISPPSLNKYAKGGYESAELNAEARKGDNHIMAAAHTTGSGTVHLDSNPKGSSLYKPYAVKGAGPLGAHAETAAVSSGIEKDETKTGWSVGLHGHFKPERPGESPSAATEPCKGCQVALGKAAVTYQKADGTIVRPKSPVAGSSAQAPAAAEQHDATAGKRKASKSPTPEKDKTTQKQKQV